MTFEQKVEKLRGICDKKIMVYCETEDEDREFCKVANEIGRNRYDCYDDDCYYYVYEQDDSIEVDYSGCEIEGYQIIPYSEFFNDKDKPLENYTLKEVKEYCQYEKVKDANSDYCEECKFNVVCGMCADEWSLKEDKIKLTQSEIEILKAIRVVYPKCDTIFHSSELEMFTNNDKGYGLIQLNTNRLPSLSHDVTYSISKLLEGVD